MGKIIAEQDKVVVSIPLSDLILMGAKVKLPGEIPEGAEFVVGEQIGHLITRAVWEVVREKAPQHAREYEAVAVDGKGKVEVTFFLSGIGNE